MSNKILVVDDEPDLLKVTVLRLKTKGFDVISAVNGEEAVRLAREQKPDLILLDLRLPDMFGDEVCRRIRAIDQIKMVPIILFTASTNNVFAAVKASGADDYLTKPFEPDALLEKVKKFLK